MKNSSIESFINTVNTEWQVNGGPQSNEASQELMNQLFLGCGIETRVKIALRRPIPNVEKFRIIKKKKKEEEDATGNTNKTSSTMNATTSMDGKTTLAGYWTKPTEEAGMIDIRTLDPSLGNFVIKFRFGKRSACQALALLLKILDVEKFKEFYPEQKVVLLALSFNPKSDPILKDWLAVIAKDEEIVDTIRHSDCLERPEFEDLKYKEKPLREYFKNEAKTKKES